MKLSAIRANGTEQGGEAVGDVHWQRLRQPNEPDVVSFSSKDARCRITKIGTLTPFSGFRT